ncbi:MAG: hypothetical protein OEU54_10130 [Gemmatimonadota bacterium]|nr:hypothetical protein [Gemmatimonadota bacterium]
MIPLLRNAGFGLIILGLVLVLIWVIAPLRAVWPWLMMLPLIMRIGVIAAALGLAVLLGSLITERVREREADKSLLDDF